MLKCKQGTSSTLSLKMNKLTASYIAGLVDGEGCLDLLPFKEKYFRSRLRIAMINKKLIYWLKNSFGGSVYTRKAFGNNRESYCWAIENKKILEPFLREIVPYLMVKKEEAETMLKYFKTFNENSFIKTDKGKQLKDDVFLKRKSYSLKIKELKRVCSVND